MTVSIKVCGYHIDVFQHVNNARYLEFIEQARWHWLEAESLLPWLQQQQIGLAAVNINIDYCLPVVLGDRLLIESELIRLGHKSAVLRQVILRQSDKVRVADARVTFVCLDLKTRCSMPFEGILRQKMQQRLSPHAAP